MSDMDVAHHVEGKTCGGKSFQDYIKFMIFAEANVAREYHKTRKG
jgi:hypothetical protein